VRTVRSVWLAVAGGAGRSDSPLACSRFENQGCCDGKATIALARRSGQTSASSGEIGSESPGP
jgi:hypothetical protein